MSVGATENIIMAASLAKGTTVIKNAAREPEVIDLCNCIISMGGQIDGIGTSTIIIDGVDQLKSTKHNVLGDRIEMGTFMLAPAIAGGKIKIKGCNTDYLNSFIEKLVETGVNIKKDKNEIMVEKNIDVLKPINFTIIAAQIIGADIRVILAIMNGKTSFLFQDSLYG